MRKFNVTVNGKSYVVEVEESGASSPAVSATVSAPAPAPAPVSAPAGGTSVTSPMPGTVLKLCVANGAKVAKNDKLVVLEAMKMENDIVANADGTVTFAVKQGDAVETGAVIATIA